jgi:hypothetical protein
VVIYWFAYCANVALVTHDRTLRYSVVSIVCLPLMRFSGAFERSGCSRLNDCYVALFGTGHFGYCLRLLTCVAV